MVWVVVVALVLAGAGLVPVASASSGSGFAAWHILPAAPLGRPYTVASVWTGSELLVAGRAATPGGVGYNVAAAYRPATDRWRALSAPPPFTGTRPGQVRAVWSGREMLLWGAGLQAAYDPATNHWRRLPAIPPGPGQIGPGGHVLAWTGRQMIIWGGDAGADARSGGATYDPVTNSWRRLPPAPLAARNAVGAWTGQELVVAGGHDVRGTVFSDAAAYDLLAGCTGFMYAVAQAYSLAAVAADAGAARLRGGDLGRFRGAAGRRGGTLHRARSHPALPGRCRLRPEKQQMAVVVGR